MVISFPGGAGGNWLKCLLEEEPLEDRQINFHQHRSKKSFVRLVHDLNPDNFDFLFSGQYYFNFYVNLIYKLFYNDLDFTATRTYKEYYTECVNSARHICKFENIKQHIFFSFDDLVHDDQKFFNRVTGMVHNIDLSYDNFVDKKQKFFDTMVRTQDMYENFEDQMWVTFVLGQLMNHDIVPEDFSIYEPENQIRAAEFAQKHYRHCRLNHVHHFDSQVVLPKILQSS